MAQQSADLKLSPSEETIRLGPLTVRFLLTGDNSTDSIRSLNSLSRGRTAPGGPGA